MPKIKFCLIIVSLILVVFQNLSLASNWAWVEKPVQPVQWDFLSWPPFMAYDKSTEKLTLLINDQNTGAVQVWTFSDDTWTKAWEGIPDMGDLSPWYHFRYVFNSYFDENLNRLVIWGGCPGYQFETWCHALFKYEPGVGFAKITDCIPIDDYSNAFPPLTITFDANRHRAVIVGAFRIVLGGVMRFVTIEYDGNMIYYVPNPGTPPGDMYFANGTSGFDPISGHVVFYGAQDSGCPLQTWEYDGQTWTLIATSTSPPTYDPIIGMIRVPELGGLLAIPNGYWPTKSWLYRNHQWLQLQVDSQFDSVGLAAMTFDHARRTAAYYGEYDNHRMWELRCLGHCRPVARP